MKHKKTFMSAAFLLFGLGGLHAQESPTAAGGEATGTGGTASYSVGQVVYTTATGTNGSVAQGVQQPYEISTTVGINESSINLEMSVYPNPTANYLTLKVDDTKNLSYLLIDATGKVIKSNTISNVQTKIDLQHLAKAYYFVKVVNNNQLIKTFKVIKN
jgi:hypothetical protein